MVVSALVASLNPAINPRQNSGCDSAEARAPLRASADALTLTLT